MSSSDVSMLVDMGFSQAKAERALQITGNKGVEPAMEWLLAHSDGAEPSPGLIAENPVSIPVSATESPQENIADASNEDESAATAKSIKCDVCGKLFKSNLEVEFHATKSGHDSFSESTEEKKPLTEEEKKEQLRLLEEKMRQKRKEREELEKKEAFEKEKLRIRSGKEMVEAKKKLEDLEMKKLLEQRKREKEEEKLAKQRVREQIEADKAARRARAASDAGRVTLSPVASIAAPTVVSTGPKKNYSETKLQIRLTNGQALTQTFGSKEQLSAVRLYIEMNRTDGSGLFNLMTTFPRKIFTEDDYEKPLDILGLVPTAVVIVQKKTELQ
ncbi:UBX domain-containing protein 1 [Neodiprion virginianus]|uniref:UBX domain-containing protein 1 n=1 Tax=Neodiprion virginianus TaxID=2961670 RepID=UPI001EE764DF|nr:UBX domain-containing protein 1 [Neodiprion virginianus]